MVDALKANSSYAYLFSKRLWKTTWNKHSMRQSLAAVTKSLMLRKTHLHILVTLNTQ